jgi:hypothetical protein
MKGDTGNHQKPHLIIPFNSIDKRKMEAETSAAKLMAQPSLLFIGALSGECIFHTENWSFRRY